MMASAGKVSVIIPVYNARETLARAVESVCAQTYANVEILLVNDGSRDNSLELCKALAEKDSRISVLDKANGGPSSARNMGMAHATGEYLMFADADDWLEPEMVQAMVARLEADESDVCVSSFSTDILKEGVLVQAYPMALQDITVKGNQNVRRHAVLSMENSIIYGCWNKLYKAEYIRGHKMRFDEEMDLGEDLVFNLAYFAHVQGASFLGESYYHYIQYESNNNLTTKLRSNKLEIMELWIRALVDFARGISEPAVLDFVEWMKLRWLLSCIISVVQAELPNKEKKKEKRIEIKIKKREYIRRVLQKEHFNPQVRGTSLGLKKQILRRIFRTGNITLIYMLSFMIGYYKTRHKSKYFRQITK